MFAALLGWYAYTRVYWTAAALHATLPPCPFLFLTGHPCPFCGGTRSFASVWTGDLGRALQFHPLGPAFFAGGLGTAAVAAWTAVGGKRLDLRLSHAQERGVYAGGAAVVLAAWAVKLIWLS